MNYRTRLKNIIHCNGVRFPCAIAEGRIIEHSKQPATCFVQRISGKVDA